MFAIFHNTRRCYKDCWWGEENHHCSYPPVSPTHCNNDLMAGDVCSWNVDLNIMKAIDYFLIGFQAPLHMRNACLVLTIWPRIHYWGAHRPQRWTSCNYLLNGHCVKQPSARLSFSPIGELSLLEEKIRDGGGKGERGNGNKRGICGW